MGYGRRFGGTPPRRRRRGLRWDRVLLLVASLALCAFGLARLIGYGIDWLNIGHTKRELNAAYVREPEQSKQAEVAAPPLPTDYSAAERGHAIVSKSTLPPVPYPGNPVLAVNERFDAVRQINPDIVGWLFVGGLLSEPVVQRDNEYYMAHDARGRRNDNGAIFLDVNADLSTRPYTLIIYGHNMKSGAMFGCLRNYEYADFCERHPRLRLDTLYEAGRYVLFAVGRISDSVIDEDYVDLYMLSTSMDMEERQSAIEALKSGSIHPFQVDVRPEDQLLLLVTCTEEAGERRVVAARRLREGEEAAIS